MGGGGVSFIISGKKSQNLGWHPVKNRGVEEIGIQFKVNYYKIKLYFSDEMTTCMLIMKNDDKRWTYYMIL